MEDLKRATEGWDSTMLFAISCGLSAPYVAGQIDYAMQQVRMIKEQQKKNDVTVSSRKSLKMSKRSQRVNQPKRTHPKRQNADKGSAN